MFFILAKTVGILLIPSNFLVFLLVLALFAGVLRYSFIAKWLGGFAVLGILIFGLSPAANVFLYPLENCIKRTQFNMQPEGIIVLGGSFDTVVSHTRQQMALSSAGERIFEAAVLAKQFADIPIIVTGAKSFLPGGEQAESEAKAGGNILRALGVADEHIIEEDQARDTFENALYSHEIAKSLTNEENVDNWLLVTSAYHMPRAYAIFQQVGFSVSPYPVDYRTRGKSDIYRGFVSISSGLRRSDIAIREWLGLIAYYAAGRISTNPFQCVLGDKET